MKSPSKTLSLIFAFSTLCMLGCDPGRGGRGGNGGSGGSGGTGGNSDFGSGQDDAGFVGDPTTCADAEMYKTYIGCDYWPTVVANAVWSIFDFAVVVSNPGTTAADVTVTGPNGTNQSVTVQPNALVKIYLPWVPSLKGPDATSAGSAQPLTASVLAKASAYHLVASVPVLVYQFNALEYAPKNGAPGKKWNTCPGKGDLFTPPCFSYSNDASLLLPSTAMTGNYRIFTEHGNGTTASPFMPGYFAITATQANTTVKIQLSSTGNTLAGTGVTAIPTGGKTTVTLNAGDVLELMGQGTNAVDLSGSEVQADKPIQVVAGVACISNPAGGTDAMGSPLSCDHIEETVMPEETLGRHYVVTRPTGPHKTPVTHTVRLVGNVDGTNLTYMPAVAGAPTTISAGEVVEIGEVTKDFEVTGDHEFIVTMIQQSGGLVDPNAALSMQEGDPSLSAAVAVEQYRLNYVFLAPSDYDFNFADVVMPMGTTIMLDGAAVTTATTQLGGGSTYGVVRIPLTAGSSGGAHTLIADQPVGLQIIGYGLYTSYQYPAGLNLLAIAPPPPPIP